MTEKYKIYLPEDTRSRLVNDAELFEFTREDESVNLNAFLKTLIVNYFEQYRTDSEELLSDIISDLTSVRSIKAKDASALADKLISTYIRKDRSAPGKSSVITLTVSGASLNIINIIENNMLRDSSLSGYLKDMFTSYLSIPRSRREEIIFKDTYEDIRRALDENRRLSFTSSINDNKFVVEPYVIATSKEEQFNYLLCKDIRTGTPRTFRISRLRSTFVTSEIFETDEELEEELHEKAIRSPHSVSPDISAVIRLTEAGVRKFKVVIKNRPAVTKIEGDLYFFDWPEMQLEEYFKRFGKDAVVIKPRSLKTKLKKYYEQALKAYAGR